MIAARHLRRLAVAKALVVCSGAAASAATAEVAASLTDLPWLQIAVAAVIGLVGGACNVLLRYLPTVYDEAQRWSWRAEIGVALVIAPAGGAASYVAATQMAASAASAGLAAFSAGVLGAYALRSLALRFAPLDSGNTAASDSRADKQ